MLRLTFSGVLAAFLLPAAGPSPARAEGADKDAKAVIAKAVEARGGAANRDKYNASVTKFKGTISIMNMDVAMSGTTKDQIPDKVHLEAAMKFPGQDQEFNFVQVIDGDKGWQGLNGRVTELDKDALAEARQEFHAGQVADLRGLNGPDVKLSSLGEATVDGKAAAGVRVSAKGYRDVSLYFDKDTGLLLKSETKGKDPQGGGREFKSETFYSDYKKVSGVEVPYKLKVLRDGKPYMQMDVTSVTLSEKLPDKDFAKP